ncbi:GT23 domain-containing protein [Meloidogyne graminicola]|uniref:GT23 domain-containing protein n=1 Tax=Meloidogyne graminicola TaxID=189291 RepID=A0A8S9ZFG2_9BILA|nr:GT23 domain-containing protein [Meloidogyne graminicola]
MSLIYNISIIFILIFITILISITYFNNQNEQIVFRLTVRNGKLDKANDCTDLLMKNDLIVAEIRQQIKELFDLVGTSVNYDKNDKAIDSRNEFIRRQFGRLLGQVEGLSGQTYNTHKTELDRLAQHLKTVLYKLQYPVDCSKTRLLVCSEYKSTPQQERIVFLKQRADTIGLTHMPELAPTEYKEILLKHHTDPPAWFMGQLIGFVLRQNEVTHQKVKDIESKFNLTNETFAGIHVRRTDKAREAAFHELEEYIKWIDFWYTSTNQNNTLNKRRLFISTDEPDKIIAEAEKRWGSQYVLLHNSKKGFC